MKQFDRLVTENNEVYKVCPDCQEQIKPEITYCYEYEWCPYCGCNADELLQKGIIGVESK